MHGKNGCYACNFIIPERNGRAHQKALESSGLVSRPVWTGTMLKDDRPTPPQMQRQRRKVHSLAKERVHIWRHSVLAFLSGPCLDGTASGLQLCLCNGASLMSALWTQNLAWTSSSPSYWLRGYAEWSLSIVLPLQLCGSSSFRPFLKALPNSKRVWSKTLLLIW